MPKKRKIPVYDICGIASGDRQNDLLIERFGHYLEKHYHDLHLPHGHSFYHLVMFTSGSGTHSIDFTRYPVAPGQIYAMAPGQVHSWTFTGPTDGYIVNFSPAFFQSFLSDPSYLERFVFFDGVTDGGVRQLNATAAAQVAGQFELILEKNAQPAENADPIRIELLRLFFLMQSFIPNGPHVPAPRQKQQTLRQFRQLVEKHYRALKLPREYAGLLHITPNHLNALVTDLTGRSAGSVIRDRVLLEAKRLLTNAGMSVAEIAYDLEFQDNSYFTRFFKKYTGQTPEAFRKAIYSPIS